MCARGEERSVGRTRKGVREREREIERERERERESEYIPGGMYFLSTSGTTIPSSVWLFSNTTQIALVVAHIVALSMWTYSACTIEKKHIQILSKLYIIMRNWTQ
jgi:hypothetical protein